MNTQTILDSCTTDTLRDHKTALLNEAALVDDILSNRAKTVTLNIPVPNTPREKVEPVVEHAAGAKTLRWAAADANSGNVAKTHQKFCVPIAAQVQAELVGYPLIDAGSPAEAIAKVLLQIDAGTLDPNLEMDNLEAGYSIPYGDITRGFDCALQIVDECVAAEGHEEAES